MNGPSWRLKVLTLDPYGSYLWRLKISSGHQSNLLTCKAHLQDSGIPKDPEAGRKQLGALPRVDPPPKDPRIQE